jgi:hypothetical protein
MQVEGTLTIANAYSTPFEPVCASCNSPTGATTLIKDAMVDCTKCSQKHPFTYQHCLNAIIRTSDNKTVQCIVREPLLHNILPSLIDMSYVTYLHKKTAIVYMLRDLQVRGRFTVNEDNILLHLKLGEGKKVNSLKLEPLHLLLKSTG